MTARKRRLVRHPPSTSTDNPNPTIEDELPRIIAGEVAAVTRFVHEVGPDLRAVARRLTVRSSYPGTEEDLVQEAFEHLFEDDARVLRQWTPDGGSRLRGFVLLVGRRYMIDFLRKHGRETPAEDSVLEAHESQTVGSDETAAAFRINIQKVMDEFYSSASHEERYLLEEHILGGRTTRALEEELGLSPAALYQRVCRLRKRLQDIYRRLTGESPGTDDGGRKGGKK